MVYDLRFMVHGLRFMDSVLWSMVHGSWCVLNSNPTQGGGEGGAAAGGGTRRRPRHSDFETPKPLTLDPLAFRPKTPTPQNETIDNKAALSLF